jgi:hypothetical protein
MRSARHLFWITFVFFLMTTAAIVPQIDAAQIFPANDVWYYGYQQTPGDEPDTTIADSYDVIAYQLDGETVNVIEGLADIPRLFSLGPDHVLVAGEQGDQIVYYDLEGTAATPLELTVEAEDYAVEAQILMSYRAPYALLSNGQVGTQLIIADLETDTIQLADLASSFYGFETCCVLTENGKLQYFARLDTDETSFGLVERDLATGEERTLFTDPELQIGVANRSGDRWLLSVNLPATRERQVIIWQGDAEQRRETLSLSQRVNWIGDSLYRDDVLCETDCEITLEAPEGETTSFTVNYPDAGEGTNRLFFPYRLLADGSLIGSLRDPDQIVKITPEGEVMTFGYWDVAGITTNGSGGISFDGRFVAVTPDPDEGLNAVVDTETGETVVETDPENQPDFVSVFFFEEGVLVNAFGDPSAFQFYRDSDGQIFELPSETNTYVEVVDDNTLLYLSRGEDFSTAIGLYTLDTGEQQIVVEGLRPLQERPAIR